MTPLHLVSETLNLSYPLTRLLSQTNRAMIATTTRIPPMDIAAMMCMKVLSAQMIGPARMMMATTTIHVGKFCFVWVDKVILSSSAGRVAHCVASPQQLGSPITFS